VASLIIGTLQTPLAVADDVRYRIMPYLWTAGIDAEIGRPGFTTDVEVEFSDYLDLIDMGAAFVFEARGDRWSFATDLLWMQLGEEFEVPTGTIDAEMDMMLVEVFGGYRPSGWENTWIVGGMRYVDIDTDINFVVLGPRSSSQDFVDPFIGLAWQPRRDNWEYVVQADIGGGIDADFSWSVTLGGVYHFNDLLGVGFGYRLIDIDFEDDEFVFDGKMDGIQIGLMFTF
jgi:opacity protein-like surface antigen